MKGLVDTHGISNLRSVDRDLILIWFLFKGTGATKTLLLPLRHLNHYYGFYFLYFQLQSCSEQDWYPLCAACSRSGRVQAVQWQMGQEGESRATDEVGSAGQEAEQEAMQGKEIGMVFGANLRHACQKGQPPPA